MCLQMCLWVHVCLCVCVRACVDVCTSDCVEMCQCVCTRVFVCAGVFKCLCLCGCLSAHLACSEAVACSESTLARWSLEWTAHVGIGRRLRWAELATGRSNVYLLPTRGKRGRTLLS